VFALRRWNGGVNIQEKRKSPLAKFCTMADVSLPNQSMSPYQSLLQDGPAFLNINSPQTWRDVTMDGQDSHEQRTAFGKDVPDFVSSNSSESLSSEPPALEPSTDISSKSSVPRPQRYPVSRRSQSKSPERETVSSQQDSAANMSRSTAAGDCQPTLDSTLPGRQIASGALNFSRTGVDTSSDQQSPPLYENMPSGHSAAIRQPRRRDGDLNANFFFPRGGGQPIPENIRRMDDLYLETHKPTQRPRARPSRTPANDLPAFNFGNFGSDSTSNAGASNLPLESLTSVPSSTSPDTEEQKNGGNTGFNPSGPTIPEAQRPDPRWHLGPPSGSSFHRHRRSGAALSISKDGPVLPRLRPFGSAPSTPVELQQDFNMQEQMAQVSANSSVSPTTEGPPSPKRRESAPSSARRRPLPPTAPFQPRPLSTIASDSGSSSSLEKELHKASNSLNSIYGPTSSPIEGTNPSINSTLNDISNLPSPSIPETTSVSIGAVPNNSAVAIQDPGTFPGLTSNPSTPGEPSASAIPRSVPVDPVEPSQASTLSMAPSRHFPIDQTTPDRRSRRQPRHGRSESSGELTRPRTSPGRAQSEQVDKYEFPMPEFPTAMQEVIGKPTAGRLDGLSGFDPHSPSMSQTQGSQLPASIDFDDECSTAIVEVPQVVPPNGAELAHASQQGAEAEVPDIVTPLTSSFPSTPVEEYPSLVDLDCHELVPEAGQESVSSSAAAAVQRRMRMHSSGGRGGYSGPVVQYHRRSESAPEMPPPSFARMSRMGSNAEMADVFEEEEEEHGAGMKAVADNSIGILQSSREGESSEKNFEVPASDEREAKLGCDEGQVKTTGALQTGSETDHIDTSAGQDVQVADDDEWAASVARSSDSTVTPRALEEAPIKRPASAPLEVTVRTTASFYAPSDFHPSAPSSGFPSPDPASLSFDHPRLPTATSSITDRGTFNSATSENYWGVRGSVDRTPELTEDDDSMLTGAIPRYSSGAVTNSSSFGDRRSVMNPGYPPASPVRPSRSATARKRSSLASLSKLMTTPGSKLRNEEKIPDETTEYTEGKKKNRLSRLMGFFKKS
jgi:hypothetical protein